MSAKPNSGDRAQAENVLDTILAAGERYEAMRVLAEAFADARVAGAREVMDRLGPIIADAEVARCEIADEVYP